MAKWEDVILSADFKATLRKDVSGFFSSEELYKKYSIPWKACTTFISTHTCSNNHSFQRGLLMHGPPGTVTHPCAWETSYDLQGNGKTISLKAIMKDCIALGHAPLYVKSFQS